MDGVGRRAGGGSPVLRSENFTDQGVSLPPFLTLGAQDTWATSLVRCRSGRNLP